MVGLTLLRGSEENQGFQFFPDVVQAVLALGLDEDDGSAAHLRMLGTDLHAGLAGNHIIEFVFVVQLLGIGRARCQNLDAGAHGRNAQKLEIKLALGRAFTGEIADMEEMSQFVGDLQLRTDN